MLWSRRKLTLLLKVLYALVLLMVEGLVHAVIHVHNFLLPIHPEEIIPKTPKPPYH